MSVEQAIEIADQIGAKKTYLIHMTHHVNHAIAETKLPKKVRFAYDNLVVEIC
jgi:phosphoribosyl 1,2-cyclic phosphate phosphodiesterase